MYRPAYRGVLLCCVRGRVPLAILHIVFCAPQIQFLKGKLFKDAIVENVRPTAVPESSHFSAWDMLVFSTDERASSMLSSCHVFKTAGAIYFLTEMDKHYA